MSEIEYTMAAIAEALSLRSEIIQQADADIKLHSDRLRESIDARLAALVTAHNDQILLNGASAASRLLLKALFVTDLNVAQFDRPDGKIRIRIEATALNRIPAVVEGETYGTLRHSLVPRIHSLLASEDPRLELQDTFTIYHPTGLNDELGMWGMEST